MIDATQTVRDIAVQIPNATRLFENLGIDYCCGGGISLAEACVKASIPVSQILHELTEQSSTTTTSDSHDWVQSSLTDLIAHIVTKHHSYVKQELPRLEQLLTKVASKHGGNHPELKQVQLTFARLSAELISHLMKEEQILFPYVKEAEAAAAQSRPMRPPMFGTVRSPIHMMELEHDAAGDTLRELRKLTSDFTAPENGCFSYQILYRGLAEFEADLHQHIHLENNILFPRAIALETKTR